MAPSFNHGLSYFRQVILLMTRVRTLETGFAFSKSIILVLLLLVVMLRHKDMAPKPTPKDNLDNPAAYKQLKGVNGTSTVLFWPNTTVNNGRMQKLKQFVSKDIPNFKVLGFSRESDLLHFYDVVQVYDHASEYPMAVIFDGSASNHDPKKVHYTIRPYVEDVIWHTQHDLLPSFYVHPHTFNDYFAYGFAYLQLHLDRAIISQWTIGDEGEVPRYTVHLQRTTGVIEENANLCETARTIVIAYKVCLCFTTLFYVVAFTKIREAKIKLLMNLHGLSNKAYWTALFAGRMLGMAVYVLAVPILLVRHVLLHSSLSLILVLFLLHAACVVTLSVLVCMCFSRARGVVGMVMTVYLAPAFLGIDRAVSSYFETISFPRHLTFLLHEVAFSCGMTAITEFEFKGKGATWSTLATPIGAKTDVTILHTLVSMLVDIVIMLAFTWYMDKVGPLDKSLPFAYPRNFCLETAYWVKNQHGSWSSRSSWERSVSIPRRISSAGDKSRKYGVQEPEEANVSAGIIAENLHRFQGECHKLTGVSFACYEGQITVLLGHKSAGKSTLLGLITGYPHPSGGSVCVLGLDVCESKATVRQNLGVVRYDHNYLMHLTVIDHILLFAALKGVPQSEAKSRAKSFCEELGLQKVLKAKIHRVPSWEKRMIYIVIAFIGEPKVVLLDEPTSGLEPASVRLVWAFLKRRKAGRTILLASHHMGEALTVGDRIAILTDGYIECCGSPLFLKLEFRVGYHVLLHKGPECDTEAVTATVKNVAPSAWLERNRETVLSYMVPAPSSDLMLELLRDLHRRLTDLGLVDISVVATTLQEVFFKLRVNHHLEHTLGQPTAGPPSEQASSVSQSDDRLDQGFRKLTGMALWRAHLKAMFFKKFMLSWRNRKLLLLIITIPLLPGLFGVVYKTQLIVYEAPKELVIGPDNVNAYSTTGNCHGNVDERYKSLFDKDAITKVESVPDFFRQALEDLGSTEFNRRYWIGADFHCTPNGRVKVTAYFNPQPCHTFPITLAYAMNAIAKAALLDNSYNIEASNFPIQKLKPQKTNIRENVFTVPFLFILGIAFMFCIMAAQQNLERARGAKQLQMLLGVHPLTYWLTSLAWDLMLYLVPCTSMTIALAITQPEGYESVWSLAVAFLLLFLYGWASIPTVYSIQVWCHFAVTAMIGVIFWSLVGLIAVLLVNFDKNIAWMARLLLPHVSFLEGMEDIAINSLAGKACRPHVYRCRLDPDTLCCEGCSHSRCIHFEHPLSLSYPGVGFQVLLLSAHGILAFILTLVIDCRKFRSRTSPIVRREEHVHTREMSMDKEVIDELQRVKLGHAADDLLVLEYLAKQYGNTTAVRSVCLGVKEGECFGILGERGAGKSTLLRMVAGKDSPTSGDVFINGLSVTQRTHQVQHFLSYCGDTDTILDKLTAEEMLVLVGKLRGVPEKNVYSVARELLAAADLEEYPLRSICRFSREYKRKLSIAMALIGTPDVVLLDEPTADMDPLSRSTIWGTLNRIRNQGTTIFMTTESLEEAEAVCTRLAVMVNGTFVCLGSPQHLRKKYSVGYVVHIEMMIDEHGAVKPALPLMNHILQVFPFSKTFEDRVGNVHCELLDDMVSVYYIFSVLESCKKTFGVDAYTVHKASLEIALLSAFKAQIPPRKESVRPQGLWERPEVSL